MSQLPLFVPDSAWETPRRLPSIPSGQVVAIDTETRDDGLGAGGGPGWVHRRGHLAGVAVAWGSHAVYLPLRHPDSENMDVGEVMRWLQSVIDGAQRIVFHNQQYDEGWLGTEGVRIPEGRTDDTQSMCVLLDENWEAYNLDACCSRAGVAGKDEGGLREAAATYGLDPKRDLWRLPARYVGPYAEQDARATLELRRWALPQLQEQGLVDAYQLEMDLVPMAIAMRRRGIRIDEEAAERVQVGLRQRRDALLEELRDQLAWRSVTMEHLNSPDHLMRAFDQEGIDYPRTPKTRKGSFKAQWLEAQQHWLPRAVRDARKLHDLSEKFIGTYILDSTHLGRVHAEIHLLRDEEGGTRTFRLSYSDPPLQQMPARDPELAPLVRGIFLPEEGTLWGSEDYSQQEPRLGVHFASLCRVPGAADAVAYYRNDPGADFHQMVSDLTGLSRKQSKIINLGLMYNMGLAKLAVSLGVSVDEATEILNQYNSRMPWVKKLNEFCEQRAERRGFIRMIDGARGHFDHWEGVRNGRDGNAFKAPRRMPEARAIFEGQRLRRADTRKAMNKLIQGSAARQTKMAMRECWRAGILPLIQLHDELGFPFESEAQAREVAIMMRDVIPLEVPMKVDAQFGFSWGQASEEPADKKTAPPSWAELMQYGPSVPSAEIISARGGSF